MGRRAPSDGPDGFLLVDKPRGWTSFDVVARLRSLMGTRRIGHTGTLDPMATGLMVVLLGRATRLAPYVTELDKAYEADIKLGSSTNTYDAEGDVVAQAKPESLVPEVLHAELLALLPQFRGQIEQRPPAFSAIKIDGERAYAKARRGEGVVIPRRTVTVDRLELLSAEQLTVVMAVECSKGTYIRSLAHDLGQALGVGAHLIGLRRTSVGRFRVDNAHTIKSLEQADPVRCREMLGTLAEAVNHLNTVVLNDEQVQDIRHGKKIVLGDGQIGLARALDHRGTLVAIIDINEHGHTKVRRGIPPAAT